MARTETTFLRRITPLSAAVFLEVFIDCAFLLPATFPYVFSFPGITSYSFLRFVLPYLVMLPVAGFAADRLPKRFVLILSKLCEFLLLLICAALLRNGIPISSLSVWILPILAVKAAFFTVSMNGILPETFPEEEISGANGTTGLAFFLGLTVCAPSSLLFFALSGGNADFPLVLLASVSLLGMICAFRILPVVSALQKKKELAYSLPLAPYLGWREIFRKPSLLLAALGDGFFLAIGSALVLLISTIMLQPKAGGGSGLIPTCLMPVLGIAFGCSFAGKISRKKIELGLVPFGAAGVAFSLPLAAFLHGEPRILSMRIPDLLSISVQIYPTALFFLFLAGIGGGLFIVPLRAYFQQRVRPQFLGAASAASTTAAIFLVLVVSGTVLAGLPPAGESKAMDLSPYWMVVSLGAVTFLVTLFSMWILPDFALRFLIIALGNTFYRTRIRGAENIPSRGPALLLSNHVSFIDSILISACTSRRIRFLMHEDYFQVPLLSPVARMTGFIRVPSAGKFKGISLMFDEVKNALRRGEIICVFPEGKMTKNGVMGRFAGGFGKMLPEDMDVPVIPVSIGNVWGSIFSHFYGKVSLRLPRELPYSAVIAFGKSLHRDVTAFEVRQKISELAAESFMERMPRERTLHYLALRNAGRFPFRVQMRDFEGESYTVLRTACEALLLSRMIREMLPSEVKYAGIMLPNSCRNAVAILAVLFADKVPVPLNPTTTQEVFEASAKKAGLTHIFTTRETLSKVRIRPTKEMTFLEDMFAKIGPVRRALTSAALILLPYKELLAYFSPLSCDHISGTAALLFSSGSTGVPKGAMLTHHNMATDVMATAQLLGLKPWQDHIVGNLPLFHSFGLNTGFWIPLMFGCEVTYLESPLDAAKLGKLLEKYKPTVLFATPSFLQAYLRKCTPEQFGSVRLVFTGAEKLRSDIAEKYHAMTHREIVELYGCTELSPVVSINLTPETKQLGVVPSREGSIGTPLSNLSVRIVDPLTHEPVPVNSEGLLFVKGPTVMEGYLDDPELTKKVMFDGYYNTGDVAKMDSAGYLSICGRLSRFSKIAGEMVPHEMVERIINEMFHLDTRAAAVGSIPDPVKGEALLVLYTDEMPMTPAEVVDQLRERSISNLWIPKAQNFYKVDHLPLLGSGKLDLAHLRQIAEDIAKERAKANA